MTHDHVVHVSHVSHNPPPPPQPQPAFPGQGYPPPVHHHHQSHQSSYQSYFNAPAHSNQLPSHGNHGSQGGCDNVFACLFILVVILFIMYYGWNQ